RSIRDAATATPRPKKLPREQWRIVVRDKYPAYVSWETFEKIQAMLRDRAGRLDVSAARIAFAASLSGIEALLNPMPGYSDEAGRGYRS
ncbi:MAG TPA: recombinase family protein, partial [Enterovirga sp.]